MSRSNIRSPDRISICRLNQYLEIEYSICRSNYYLEIEYSICRSNYYLEIEYSICRSNKESGLEKTKHAHQIYYTGTKLPCSWSCDHCDHCDSSLGSLEDVSSQHRYDIVQTTVPLICSPFFFSSVISFLFCLLCAFTVFLLLFLVFSSSLISISFCLLLDFFSF